MMRFEIVDNKVHERTITSKRDGKSYTFYTQEAYFHDGDSPYPVLCNIPVSSPTAGYSPGWYTLAAGSFFVDRYRNLAIARRFSLVNDKPVVL